MYIDEAGRAVIRNIAIYINANDESSITRYDVTSERSLFWLMDDVCMYNVYMLFVVVWDAKGQMSLREPTHLFTDGNGFHAKTKGGFSDTNTFHDSRQSTFLHTYNYNWT